MNFNIFFSAGCIHLFSCIKCETIYYKWVVLQMCYKQVYEILSFSRLLFIWYSLCEHTSVSHCSLNFDAPSVGKWYGFTLIILVFKNLQCRSFKDWKSLTSILWMCYEPCVMKQTLCSCLMVTFMVSVFLLLFRIYWTALTILSQWRRSLCTCSHQAPVMQWRH